MAAYPLTPDKTLLGALGIELTEMRKERVAGTMPVDSRTHQPFGLLHGGASVALAETLASVAAQMNVASGEMVVGLEINANHLRGVRSGTVTGVATPVHVGRRTQVWSIDIRDEQGKPVCISRCTLAVIPLATG
ncbi:hotdog fold thioesterase [Hydrocarboniphaga sp.]|uniref:hotdog fold thioesterase n=1 Tax=Hydrocarboniphaga sp. TaxID=2033016 RepID=UPI003D0F2A59